MYIIYFDISLLMVTVLLSIVSMMFIIKFTWIWVCELVESLLTTIPGAYLYITMYNIIYEGMYVYAM